MKNTYFIDIDGTILKYPGENWIPYAKQEPLPFVVEKMIAMRERGDLIILCTARSESMRKWTESQLDEYNVPYDLILFDLHHGPRIIINDNKPAKEDREEIVMCGAIQLQRDEGFERIEI